MITSRSDRVPLLSHRHTPAEKQNGTSDRPTLSTDPYVPPSPEFRLAISPYDFTISTPTNFSLLESNLRPDFHRDGNVFTRTVNTAEGTGVQCTAGFIRITGTEKVEQEARKSRTRAR